MIHTSRMPDPEEHRDLFFPLKACMGNRCLYLTTSLPAVFAQKGNNSRESIVILPRNCHKSAVHALVLSGAVPVYIDAIYDERLGIHHGIDLGALRDSLAEVRAPSPLCTS